MNKPKYATYLVISGYRNFISISHEVLFVRRAVASGADIVSALHFRYTNRDVISMKRLEEG